MSHRELAEVRSSAMVRRAAVMAVSRPDLLGPERICNRCRAVFFGQGLEEAIDKPLTRLKVFIREHPLKVEGQPIPVNVVIEQEVEQNVILRHSVRFERHHANPRIVIAAAWPPLPQLDFRRLWAATPESPGCSVVRRDSLRVAMIPSCVRGCCVLLGLGTL